MKMKLFVFGLLLLSISCGKEAGEGGKNTIEGYVMTQEIRRSDNQVVAEYPSFEDRVYIIYGENAYHADNFILSYNGFYLFEELNKGKYTLFTYSDCLACESGKEAVFMDIKLKERKEEFKVDTIFKTKYVN